MLRRRSSLELLCPIFATKNERNNGRDNCDTAEPGLEREREREEGGGLEEERSMYRKEMDP